MIYRNWWKNSKLSYTSHIIIKGKLFLSRERNTQPWTRRRGGHGGQNRVLVKEFLELTLVQRYPSFTSRSLQTSLKGLVTRTRRWSVFTLTDNGGMLKIFREEGRVRKQSSLLSRFIMRGRRTQGAKRPIRVSEGRNKRAWGQEIVTTNGRFRSKYTYAGRVSVSRDEFFRSVSLNYETLESQSTSRTTPTLEVDSRGWRSTEDRRTRPTDPRDKRQWKINQGHWRVEPRVRDGIELPETVGDDRFDPHPLREAVGREKVIVPEPRPNRPSPNMNCGTSEKPISFHHR